MPLSTSSVGLTAHKTKDHDKLRTLRFLDGGQKGSPWAPQTQQEHLQLTMGGTNAIHSTNYRGNLLNYCDDVALYRNEK